MELDATRRRGSRPECPREQWSTPAHRLSISPERSPHSDQGWQLKTTSLSTAYAAAALMDSPVIRRSCDRGNVRTALIISPITAYT